MTRRVASKIMPPIWKRKPIITNLISPIEAMITPTTMTATLKRTLRLTGAIPMAQVANSTATGVVAWKSPLASASAAVGAVSNAP